MNALTAHQKKFLRGLAHDLKPVVYVGRQGLSEAVVKDIDRALSDHELIKVRFVDCKDIKRELSETIAGHTGAALLGVKGHLALFFRRSEQAHKQSIALPEQR
ncbi:MAG: ribosome assembly RNA-binding protein YhbY [Deltaproteobacteria bacterium]|nr:ribosome assembly RNA-binding protein YhbY [Deltaproteobacteria bacterium]